MSETQNTWGKTVSIKFYLNKKLKPVISGGEKRYSLYVRVVCKKQVCDFKVNDQRFTDQEMDLVLKAKAPKGLRQKSVKASLEFTISYTTYDINRIVHLVHPFEREDFILKNLPELLRTYDDTSMELHESQGMREIQESVARNGYRELIEIIDWKKKSPDNIAFFLEELQRKGKMKKFKLWHNYKPRLDFDAALAVLSGVVFEKNKYPDNTVKQKAFINRLIKENLLHPKEAGRAEITLQRAVEFANQAIKLTTR